MKDRKEHAVLSNVAMDFIVQVDEVDSETELFDLFETTIQRLGVRYFALGEVAGIAAEPPIMIGNYPQEWIRHYVANDFQYHDPVAHKAQQSHKPFDWKEVEDEGWVKGPGKNVYNTGKEFGLKSGISIPIFRSNGYLAVASFADERIEVSPDLLGTLELLTVYFHTHLTALRERARPPNVRISGREKECLHWAAVGKSDWEIGEILTISQNTAHRHIENAKRKFGVKTRVQAVLAAVKARQVRI